jgi:flavin reductase (DIM6/NTAB) family NADH-FMN oxidoreductase RutF
MLQLHSADFSSWDKAFRTNFMNSLNGFKSANLLGTINLSGVSNLAIVSSLLHLGSNPGLLGYVSRPASVSRHTYDNIQATGWFTANHVTADTCRAAHQTSARYPDEVSEFAACGFTEEYLSGIPAPFVKEARIKIGLQWEEEHHIKANGTLLLVGRVQFVSLPEEALGADGLIDLEKSGTMAISGLDQYHTAQKVARFSYAKPDRALKVLA